MSTYLYSNNYVNFKLLVGGDTKSTYSYITIVDRHSDTPCIHWYIDLKSDKNMFKRFYLFFIIIQTNLL